ncbi:type I-E CRISPR-associated protein Cse1/CasA [Aureimonas altamirensis]|uniref:type I-E CRISPR-associated protein Cse1/CasA n=1 Tax=Aureimonas altamirensis TaxID=370622 RepID=UPI002036C83B|nr:type I-E CRISPR-associated protein Cse1/CasA [Aureimonas altamirensis]MCM2502580.1 type I-E CRISPR-associated protein Cse1/CasA [Aureimonas altamirensis]
MSINLLRDAWIPVQCSDGRCRVIRPDQIAEPEIVFPAWPRPDLNIACLEFLIGLLFLADPPANASDWRARKPDAQRLRERLDPLTPAFDLLGDGPRFLQDLDLRDGKVTRVEMLFIDSAGSVTAKQNGDLVVKRNRYPVLDAPLAAMALYTLQAHAPAGGAGNRTSMRGGGPMITLADPGTGSLWDLIWANVPDGMPAGVGVLPWMRPSRISKENGSQTYPDLAHPAEAFFGMPRRLRLVGDETVTGVIQKPYGANYAAWLHALTPYYRQQEGAELLPVHPRAGAFGYRNWLGVVMEVPGDNRDLRRRASAIDTYQRRLLPRDRAKASVIVAGWALDKMKPQDFTWSRQPMVAMDYDLQLFLVGMIEAAEAYGGELRGSLKVAVGDGKALEMLREDFFTRTQAGFEAGLHALQSGSAPAEVASRWIKVMERVALEIFDREALQGVFRLPVPRGGSRDKQRSPMKDIVHARGRLGAAFAGWGKPGKDAYLKLGLTPRSRGKEAA